MYRRSAYISAFFIVLLIEIFIGLFVRDTFVRPYVGDMLVTVLLCCLCKGFFPRFPPALPVFLFAAAVEGLQLLCITERLGLSGTLPGILLGSTFDWRDLLCYAIGCVCFAAADHLARRA